MITTTSIECSWNGVRWFIKTNLLHRLHFRDTRCQRHLRCKCKYQQLGLFRAVFCSLSGKSRFGEHISTLFKTSSANLRTWTWTRNLNNLFLPKSYKKGLHFPCVWMLLHTMLPSATAPNSSGGRWPFSTWKRYNRGGVKMGDDAIWWGYVFEMGWFNHQLVNLR